MTLGTAVKSSMDSGSRDTSGREQFRGRQGIQSSCEHRVHPDQAITASSELPATSQAHELLSILATGEEAHQGRSSAQGTR
jgi:hypothetical protein